MGARFDGLVVLIVEDDWIVREDVAFGLRQEGWTVLEAETGAGALEVLREAKIVDLLITDIRLADAVTGWDVAEAFRASYLKTPVIYASGNPDNLSRRVSESTFLGKPVAISELLATCRKVLEERCCFKSSLRTPQNMARFPPPPGKSKSRTIASRIYSRWPSAS
jgi:CheY-like chemotaxis protein